MEEFGGVIEYNGLFIDLLMHENGGEVSRIVFWLLITKSSIENCDISWFTQIFSLVSCYWFIFMDNFSIIHHTAQHVRALKMYVEIFMKSNQFEEVQTKSSCVI